MRLKIEIGNSNWKLKLKMKKQLPVGCSASPSSENLNSKFILRRIVICQYVTCQREYHCTCQQYCICHQYCICQYVTCQICNEFICQIVKCCICQYVICQIVKCCIWAILRSKLQIWYMKSVNETDKDFNANLAYEIIDNLAYDTIYILACAIDTSWHMQICKPGMWHIGMWQFS